MLKFRECRIRFVLWLCFFFHSLFLIFVDELKFEDNYNLNYITSAYEKCPDYPIGKAASAYLKWKSGCYDRVTINELKVTYDLYQRKYSIEL